MMKSLYLIVCVFLNLSMLAQQNFPMRTIETSKSDISDLYFGKTIEDPSRWLEDDKSPATAQWVKEQNLLTENYLKNLTNRTFVHNQLKLMWNYTKYSSPFKEGDYYLFYKNDGLQNQSVLFIQKGLEGEPKEFLNPNTMNEKGTSSLGSIVLF